MQQNFNDFSKDEKLDFIQGFFSDPRMKKTLPSQNIQTQFIPEPQQDSQTEIQKNNYKTSDKGIELLKRFEGSVKNEKNEIVPYNDSQNNATKGYGILLHHGPLTEEDLKKYPPQTEEEATKDYREKIKEFETILNNRANYTFPNGVQTLTPIKLAENQVDALISLTYNSSGTALKVMNAIRENKTPEEIKKIWLGEKRNDGLDKRRAAEWKLFEEGIYEENPYN